MPSEPPRPCFNHDRFEEGDFSCNDGVSTNGLRASLAAYASWLGRFFVCITDEKSAITAQVFYYAGTERVDRVVCRSPKETMRTFPSMLVVVGFKGDGSPAYKPLLEWYIYGQSGRRTARHVNMWTTPEDIAANPHDLNIFGGLRWDERLAAEGPLERVAFSDPFPAGALPRAILGLRPASPSSRAATAADDAEWRALEGLQFILWHLKYVLCGGDAEAFAYLMPWFGYVMQKRRKPGVLAQFLGEEGIGKSAVLGHNHSGPGILKRIFEQYYQWTDDIESLLGKFNGESSNCLFCLMEEAGTYRKGFRNNDKLKSLITEGTMRVELKGVNAFSMNDHRAFALCTNNRDSLKITPGARRFLCLEGSDALSQKAVDEGRMDRSTRLGYMAKLDATKNDDEVAYAFFRYCMRLDLTRFHVEEPPRTALFREQRSHNECAVKLFLEQVKSGEYPLRIDVERARGEHLFTALELFGHMKTFASETGATLSVESAKSFGHLISKQYVALKVEGLRVAKYRVQICDAA